MIMRQYTLMYINIKYLLLSCSSTSARSSFQSPVRGQGLTNLKDDEPSSRVSTHVNLPGESVDDHSSIPKWNEMSCTCAWQNRTTDSIKSKIFVFKRIMLFWKSNFPRWIYIFLLARWFCLLVCVCRHFFKCSLVQVFHYEKFISRYLITMCDSCMW